MFCVMQSSTSKIILSPKEFAVLPLNRHQSEGERLCEGIIYKIFFLNDTKSIETENSIDKGQSKAKQVIENTGGHLGNRTDRSWTRRLQCDGA